MDRMCAGGDCAPNPIWQRSDRKLPVRKLGVKEVVPEGDL